MRRSIARCLVLAAATTATHIPTVGTASADGGFHFLALRSQSDVQSVYVSGKGWTNWTTDSESGTLGSRDEPVELSVCYSYRPANTGAWVQAGEGLQAHTNEAPGRQGVQRSNPRWVDGRSLSVLTFDSGNCTAGAKASRRVTVPSDELSRFWLDLR